MTEPPKSPRGLRWPLNAELRRSLQTNALVSSGIGIGLVLLMSLANPAVLVPRAFVSGALVGLCIGLGAQLTGLLLLWLFRGRPVENNRWVPTLAFFVGGNVGWLIGDWLSRFFLDFQLWPDAGIMPTIFFGLLAVSVGAVFQTVGVLRRRLEESVAELKEKEFAEKELATARAIQSRLLPPATNEGAGFELAALNLPARVVAGDFYDYFRLPDGALGLVVADVVGKGMGASLIMASVKAMLPLIAAERPVAEAMTELNRRLFQDLGSREFVALMLVRFDPENGQTEVANAGLPDPLWIGDDGCATAIEPTGERLPLGVRAGTVYQSARFELLPGQRLFCYTDGLPETPDAGGEPLGYERLASRVQEELGRNGSGEDLATALGRLVDSVRPTSTAPEDDVTALVIERTPLT